MTSASHRTGRKGRKGGEGGGDCVGVVVAELGCCGGG